MCKFYIQKQMLHKMLFAVKDFLHFKERHSGWSFLQEIWTTIPLEEASKREAFWLFEPVSWLGIFGCLFPVLLWLGKEVLSFISSCFFLKSQ